MSSWRSIVRTCALSSCGSALLWSCGAGPSTQGTPDAGGVDAGYGIDAHVDDVVRKPDGRRTIDAAADAPLEAADAAFDAADGTDGGTGTCVGDAGPGDSCYAISCTTPVHTLTDNRDRLVKDLAKRKCTDACTLWAALNEAERYIFLMDTAYLGASESAAHPPGSADKDTALDHAVALYSINGPMAGQGVLGNGLGGNDYNRIYLGFDPLAECVMRNYGIANPSHTAGYNAWTKSDDVAGPHAPFTERDMIPWFRAIFDIQSQGPQFHFWAKDSDFTQTGLNARLGVCGVTDASVTELTIAFNSFHDSNPLGKYTSDGASKGGFGWQIVDQFVGITSDWSYSPTGCKVTPPVNTSTTGGGTFAGMGSSLVGSACSSWALTDGGLCP